MSFILLIHEDPGLQAASSQEFTSQVQNTWPLPMSCSLKNAEWEKGKLQFQLNQSQQELAVPLSEPQFPYLQGSHEKGFIKELELGTASASQARH